MMDWLRSLIVGRLAGKSPPVLMSSLFGELGVGMRACEEAVVTEATGA